MKPKVHIKKKNGRPFPLNMPMSYWEEKGIQAGKRINKKIKDDLDSGVINRLQAAIIFDNISKKLDKV